MTICVGALQIALRADEELHSFSHCLRRVNAPEWEKREQRH